MSPRPRPTRDDDDDTTTSATPSRGSKSGGGSGVSLSSKDAVESGLFSSGPATVKESIFADFKYPTGEKAQVWLLTFARPGEQPYEQPYTLGKGWKVAKDGLSIIPTAGQTGLPKNCNAMQHLVPSLERCGVPQDLLDGGDPSFLEGAEVVVKRVPQVSRDGMKERKRTDGKERSTERTILEIEEIVAAPWDKGKGKAATRAKAKPAADDDDEKEEETPKKRGVVGRAVDRVVDAVIEDRVGKRGKPNGKAAPEPSDDDEADDLIEEGVEALIAALEEESPLKVGEVEAAVRAQLKGNPKAKAIAAAIADPDELDKEKGWTFNGKRVELA